MKIGLESCSDLHQKLKYEKSKLDEKWNAYDFFNFTVTAWHLQNDWLKNDIKGRPTHAMKKIHQLDEQMNEVVRIARDIANGSKHFKLDRPSMAKKVVDGISKPETRDWHSYFYGPKHGISTKTSYYSTSDFIFLIDEYFTWIFSDDLPTTDLPKSIIDHLNYLFDY